MKKLDKYKDRVCELLTSGKNASEIYRILSSETDGSFSLQTVISYVRDLRSKAEDGAFKIIKEHVERVVPDDLNALEEIESLCLNWMREAGKDIIERVADATCSIKGKIEQWRDLILSGKDDDAIIRKMIRDTIGLLAMDDRKQEQRLSAMRQAASVIELKLKHAGLLDTEKYGDVIIEKVVRVENAMQQINVLEVN